MIEIYKGAKDLHAHMGIRGLIGWYLDEQIKRNRYTLEGTDPVAEPAKVARCQGIAMILEVIKRDLSTDPGAHLPKEIDNEREKAKKR